MCSVVPSEFESINTGAPSGPTTSTWIGQPSALISGMIFPFACMECSTLAGAQLQRADDTVDEGLGDALIGHRFEQRGELADREVELHPVVLAEHGLKVAFGVCGFAARSLHDLLGLLPAELGSERERYRVGHDHSAGFAQIGAHALAVDLEALGDAHGGGERA